MPRYAAERVLLAPLDDVWGFVAEPYHLSDWWPGIAGVEPDRRGLAPGARWKTRASPIRPTYVPFGLGYWSAMARRPDAMGTLVVSQVEAPRRLAFELVETRIRAEIDLEWFDRDRTRVTVHVSAPWSMVPRTFPALALARLYDLVQTAAEL